MTNAKKKRTLSVIGNSTGVVILASQLQELGWNRDTEIETEIKAGKLIVSRKYQPFFNRSIMKKPEAAVDVS